jgi:hypothetical protein
MSITSVQDVAPGSLRRFDFTEELKSCLFQSFQIDLMDFFKTKMILYYKLNRTDGEIESYPYYEYQLLIENYVDLLEKIEEIKEGKQKLL